MEGPDPDKDGISAYTLDDLVAIAENRWTVKYSDREIWQGGRFACLKTWFTRPNGRTSR